MLNTAGLSLEQAPPLGVPLAFFLAAPVFAGLAGALLLWHGEGLLATRWSPPTLALAHLLALGFLTQIALGALLQLLPVLAGAPVSRVVLVGRLTQSLLIAGTLALAGGFWRGEPTGLLLGGVSLALSLTVFAGAAAGALRRGRGVPHTLAAMRLALGALLVTLLLGLLLLGALLGRWSPSGFADWVDLHLAWGLLGWAGLLLLGVGYQVVPMFHVTPAYPGWLMRGAAPLVSAALLLASGLTAFGQTRLGSGLLALAMAPLLLFALVTLDRQRRRARPRIDVTLLHWWTALSAMLLASGIWLAGGRAELAGVLALLGVGVGLPSGMLFKIVPFLCWFHLQHLQVTRRRFAVRLPLMQDFLPEPLARLQFGLQLLALASLAAVAAWSAADAAPLLARLGGLALLLAMLLLEWLLLRGLWRQRQVRRRLLAPD